MNARWQRPWGERCPDSHLPLHGAGPEAASNSGSRRFLAGDPSRMLPADTMAPASKSTVVRVSESVNPAPDQTRSGANNHPRYNGLHDGDADI